METVQPNGGLAGRAAAAHKPHRWKRSLYVFVHKLCVGNGPVTQLYPHSKLNFLSASKKTFAEKQGSLFYWFSQVNKFLYLFVANQKF